MSPKTANTARVLVAGLMCLAVLPGCPPSRPADAISKSSPIVGYWEGSVLLEDSTVKEGVDLRFAPTSLVDLGMFAGQAWVTWATLYEDDVSLGHTDYSFENGVASMDDDLFTFDVGLGHLSATLTLSEDGTTLEGPIVYDQGGDTAVAGILTATKRE